MIEIRASRRLENDSLVDSQVSVAITGDVLQFMDGFCFIFRCLHICMFQRTLEVLFLVENMVQWDVVYANWLYQKLLCSTQILS